MFIRVHHVFLALYRNGTDANCVCSKAFDLRYPQLTLDGKIL